MVLVIAHRGASGTRPENTLAAFRRAATLGADMIEFDIQPSRDMVLVVMHDELVNRTTNGSGSVSQLTIRELKSLDAGSWFSSRYTGEKVPTLRETLDAIPGRMKLNIEMKRFPGMVSYEEELMKIFQEYDLYERAFLAARDGDGIRAVKDIDQSVKCILIQGGREECECLSDALALDVDALQIRRSSLNEDFIERIHDQGILSFLFYADTPEEMEQAIDMGLDGILTNWPERMIELPDR